MKFDRVFYQSPVGKLQLIECDDKLAAVLWENDDSKRVRLPGEIINQETQFLKAVQAKLQLYFSGRQNFSDIPVVFWGTNFQTRVWKQLQNIPFGKTCSYLDIAKKIGSPKAARAVGAAIGKNPISIIIPCHRVIGSSGALTGFAGGLNIKQMLLNLEL